MALALRSEIDRSTIPEHEVLSTSTVPFAGELHEQMNSQLRGALAVNGRATLATLRRAWNFVGFSVDPGDATLPITAMLQVLVRGMQAFVPATLLTVTPGLGPQASVGFVMGCRAQLVVFGETGAGAVPVHRVRGTIWGMSEQ